MVLRRGQRGRKNRKALGDFIGQQLPGLRILADLLNRDILLTGDSDGAAVTEGATIIEALAESSVAPPIISKQAAELFRTMVADQTFRYGLLDLTTLRTPPELAHTQYRVGLEASGPKGAMAQVLAYHFFDNPQRDRLRRCQQCSRWFVDETRNRSAQRCSRACTIAWSNSQRPKKGTR